MGAPRRGRREPRAGPSNAASGAAAGGSRCPGGFAPGTTHRQRPEPTRPGTRSTPLRTAALSCPKRQAGSRPRHSAPEAGAATKAGHRRRAAAPSIRKKARRLLRLCERQPPAPATTCPLWTSSSRLIVTGMLLNPPRLQKSPRAGSRTSRDRSSSASLDGQAAVRRQRCWSIEGAACVWSASRQPERLAWHRVGARELSPAPAAPRGSCALATLDREGA